MRIFHKKREYHVTGNRNPFVSFLKEPFVCRPWKFIPVIRLRFSVWKAAFLVAWLENEERSYENEPTEDEGCQQPTTYIILYLYSSHFVVSKLMTVDGLLYSSFSPVFFFRYQVYGCSKQEDGRSFHNQTSFSNICHPLLSTINHDPTTMGEVLVDSCRIPKFDL